MFNFGYLPSGDKALTTQADTSLQALKMSLTCLADDALVTLLCYPGHPAGRLETDAIATWLETLPNHFLVTTHRGQSGVNSPILYVLTKGGQVPRPVTHAD